MRRVALASVLALSACTMGRLESGPQLVRSPDGVPVEITFSQGVLTAELLEVRPGGLLVLVDPTSTLQPGQRLVLVDSLLLTVPIRAAGRRAAWSSTTYREWLRRFSRFPWGISPAVERRLLELHGQEAVHHLRGELVPYILILRNKYYCVRCMDRRPSPERQDTTNGGAG